MLVFVFHILLSPFLVAQDPKGSFYMLSGCSNAVCVYALIIIAVSYAIILLLTVSAVSCLIAMCAYVATTYCS